MASEDVLERALKHVDQCSCAGEHWRKPMGYKGRCLDCQMIEDLAAELRSLRKDRERLDFILKRCWISFAWDVGSLGEKPVSDLDNRDEIDAAMAQEGER